MQYLSKYLAEPPSFLKPPSLVEGVRGKDASLHCEVTGTPPFQLAWSKGQTVLKDSRKYRVVKVGGSITLHMIKLEQDDAGTYQCQVSNHVGTVCSRTTVSLKGEQKAPPFHLSFLGVLLLTLCLGVVTQSHQHSSRSWWTSR